jgi:DNA integrity scanning protein DisA with diadenylate cyclase activity
MTGVSDALADLIEGIDILTLFSPSSARYDRVSALDDTAIMVVDSENTHDAENFVELPLDFKDIRDRVKFGIEGGMEHGFVEDGDTVLCLLPVFNSEPDTLIRVRATEEMQSGIYDFFVNSRPDPSVVRDVLSLVMELGKKGQKGKPVGALFVVGDAGKVMNISRPLSYNPFEKSHVNVGDAIVNVMLKEFSRLDGAFIISDEGVIVSAYRYLEPSAKGIDIPKGLGTRHMAAAAITRDTNAVSIVLSESDGLVRAFKGGDIVLELDPEEY